MIAAADITSVIHCDSAEDFFKSIRPPRIRLEDGHPNFLVLYRGHASDAWNLLSAAQHVADDARDGRERHRNAVELGRFVRTGHGIKGVRMAFNPLQEKVDEIALTKWTPERIKKWETIRSRGLLRIWCRLSLAFRHWVSSWRWPSESLSVDQCPGGLRRLCSFCSRYQAAQWDGGCGETKSAFIKRPRVVRSETISKCITTQWLLRDQSMNPRLIAEPTRATPPAFGYLACDQRGGDNQGATVCRVAGSNPLLDQLGKFSNNCRAGRSGE